MLPRCVYPFQLVSKVTHFGGYRANALIYLLEMLEGNLEIVYAENTIRELFINNY